MIGEKVMDDKLAITVLNVIELPVVDGPWGRGPKRARRSVYAKWLGMALSIFLGYSFKPKPA